MLQADRVKELLNIDGDVIQLSETQSVTVEDFLNVAGFGTLPGDATIQDMIDLDGGKKGYVEYLQQFL